MSFGLIKKTFFMLKNYFFYIFFLLFSFSIFAQQKESHTSPTPSIQIKTSIKTNQIALRWAVDEPLAWQKANKIGFSLKRYTLMRDGQLLAKPELKDLGVFLPKPVKDWESIIETNDKAAIIAQALYGESFEVEMGSQGELENIINKSQEIEQRFAFALMAADLDFEVAQLAGWGYVDTDVKPNERYLYSIELRPTSSKEINIEKGSAVASTLEAQPLPKPLDFIGVFRDRTVTLSWEYLQLKDIYTSYFIEKSDNGKDFTSLGDLPVINMNNNSRAMLYIDSLTQNNKNYSYRIRGKTIFGEFGPYSDIISGIGKKSLEHTPRITSFDIAENEMITINWEFPQEAEKDITHFELLHSETDKESSYHVIQSNISPSLRNLQTKSISPSNYFKIQAIGKSEDKRESFSVLIQPNDTIPPTTPTGLKGKIDSTGVVHLEWIPNTEKDLEGYHIFRGIQKEEELVRITPQAIIQNTFQDKVPLENLNSKVYYYITATDIRKNQSEASEIIELEKPDKVRPQAPVFTEYKINEGKITLNWLKSYSDDVALHQLYRLDLDENNSQWQKVFETKETQPNYSYTDEKVESNKRYRYYLLAIDKSNLQSDKSQEITLRNVDLRAKEIIYNLTSNIDKKNNKIELFWKIKEAHLTSEILVYRQKNNEIPTLWGILSGEQNFLEDNNINIGNSYTYLLKAILNNQQPAKTEKITIEF